MLANNKYVKECELVPLTIGGKKVPVAHIVLEKNAVQLSEDILTLINKECISNLSNEEAIPFAYKLRDKFPTSPISGKRDYDTLKYETEDYIKITDQGIIYTSLESEESKIENEIEKVKKLEMKI